MGRSLSTRLNVTGDQVRRLRLAARPKVSQDDMAGKLARVGLSLSQSQIAKVESGNRALKDFEVLAFAKALRVPVQRLYGLE